MPRKLERKALIHHLKVVNRNTRTLFGYVGNITTEGMLLFCPRHVRSDMVFPFEVSLPAEIGGNRQIVFDANSVWCQRDQILGMYCAGFRIERIAPKDLQVISQTIAAYASRV